MNDEIADISIKEFDRLKQKMYSFLVENNSEYKKAKDVNSKTVATISHDEYKDALLNN